MCREGDRAAPCSGPGLPGATNPQQRAGGSVFPRKLSASRTSRSVRLHGSSRSTSSRPPSRSPQAWPSSSGARTARVFISGKRRAEGCACRSRGGSTSRRRAGFGTGTPGTGGRSRGWASCVGGGRRIAQVETSGPPVRPELALSSRRLAVQRYEWAAGLPSGRVRSWAVAPRFYSPSLPSQLSHSASGGRVGFLRRRSGSRSSPPAA